ncbi:hypothetical protein EZ428_21635 [Pedobacter frigiditerrae]|uniref:Chaperone of endosialidase n=1 Tax=Pedobacter frigiditerrae TaxID=2530452 RepID=A0A4R0MMU0_9SPHI|nr:hypothetical protein [Pedobacter frigiditerrae]TCC87304.1 hypothetical protein EZ428_21635 [Pedobacter frigiditerrae]
MKNLKLLVPMLFLVNISLAQTNTFPANGNVGVGTVTPAAKLSFNNVNDGTDGADGITWYNLGPLDYGIYRTPGMWSGPSFQQLKLKWDTGIILDPGASHGKSYVDIQGAGLRVSSGNVGIGTLTPQANLDIFRAYDASQTKAVKMFYQGSWGTASYANGFRFLDIESTEGGKILQLNGNGMGIGYDPPTYGTSDKLYINGNVGIGTNNPQAKLDIFSADNTAVNPLLSIRSNFHVVGNYGMIRFGDYTQTTNYQKGAVIFESVSGAARGKFHIALENTDGSNSVSLADAKLTVQPDGNVGIGTMTPNEKLAVNGKIRAKEIRVEPNPATWPDYVFEADYKIVTLEELEHYVKTNKHLPEMPTAKEVGVNGLELGEMNRLLLKKVEELTLLLIEQAKEVKQLKHEVKLLKDKT